MRSRKTDVDMENFLRDIATLSELQALSERLEVARLLAQGFSYRQVAVKTGASTTTVTRVASFIENGEGGYRDVLHAHRHHRLNAEVKPVVSDGDTQDASEPSVTPLQKYLHRR